MRRRGLLFSAIQNELRHGDIQIIPWRGLPITRYWKLAWLSAKKLSPVARAFLDYLDREGEEFVEQHFGWSKDY